jgi:hypothetical protein
MTFWIANLPKRNLTRYQNGSAEGTRFITTRYTVRLGRDPDTRRCKGAWAGRQKQKSQLIAGFRFVLP